MTSFPGNITLNSDDILKNLNEAISVVKSQIVGLNDEQKNFLTPLLEKLVVKRNEFELEAPKASQRLKALIESNKKRQNEVMARLKAKLSALAIAKNKMAEQNNHQQNEKLKIAKIPKKMPSKPSKIKKDAIPKDIKLLSSDELRDQIIKKIPDTQSTPRTTGNIWDNWKERKGPLPGNPEQGPKS